MEIHKDLPDKCTKILSLISVISMNKISQDSNTLVFGRMNVVHPHDTRQYLYCLKPKQEARSNPAALRQATSIGKLDIVWRTNMGDRGRLQTSQLQRMVGLMFFFAYQRIMIYL